MARALTLATLLLTAACSRQDPAPAPTNDSAPASTNDVAGMPEAPASDPQVPVLAGAWQVSAIDGKPPAEPMTASFAGAKASLAAGCVRRAWAYTQKRNMVTFSADPSGSANCEGRGTSAEQATASDALQQASIVIFNQDGDEANLSGTGGNLTLRRR